MTDIDDFLNTPQRPIGPVKRARKQTPAAKLRAETIKAIQGLKYLGSRPCVIPVYTGIAEHDGVKYSVGRRGSSDLVVSWFGLFAGLEIKAGRDVISPVQAKFAERLAESGSPYIVVRKPQDAIDGLMRLYNVHIAKLQAKG